MLEEIVVVQEVAGWLTDPVTGVNALRANVPRYSGDDPPPAVTVVHKFRNTEAALGQAPLTGLPALEISTQDGTREARPAVAPYATEQITTVAIRYLAAKSDNTALQVRQAAYTLAIVQKILAARGVGLVSQPLVNQVQMQSLTNVRGMADYTSVESRIVTGALLFDVLAKNFYAKAGQ